MNEPIVNLGMAAFFFVMAVVMLSQRGKARASDDDGESSRRKNKWLTIAGIGLCVAAGLTMVKAILHAQGIIG